MSDTLDDPHLPSDGGPADDGDDLEQDPTPANGSPTEHGS